MFPLVKMTRPGNILIAVVTLAVGYFLSNGTFSWTLFCADALAFACSIAFGNLLNDILDIDSDRENCPQRPLPSGKVSLTAAKVSSGICAALCPLFASLGEFQISRILFFAAILLSLFLYDRFLKRIPLLKNVTVAFLCTTPIVRAAFLPEADLRPLAATFLFAFVFTLAREILKDLEDEAGDLKAGIFTFPLVAGDFRAQVLSSALLLFGVLSIPMPVMLGWFRPAFLLSLIPILPISLSICRKIFRKDFSSAKKWTKAAMVVGLSALVLNGIADIFR